MNGHDRPLELAASGIDFALTADERAMVDTHLRGCPACRRTVAGFATDAATMAMLPARALEPVAADAILASILQRPARVLMLRYLAIAALLALVAAASLAVGAELVRRLDHPAELTVAPSETPTTIAVETIAPSTGPTAESTATATQTVDPADCVDVPTIADLAAMGGADAAACYGSADLTMLGIIPHNDPGFEVCPGREPLWLSCNDGSYLTAGPSDETTFVPYAHDGEPPVTRPASGAAAAPGSPSRGFYSRFTGHYRDPASAECRATDPTDEYFDDAGSLRARCEATFVVTAIEVLGADAVPKPVLDGRWAMIAGPAAFGSLPGTHLTSVAELDGRLYAVTASPGDPSTFALWTSEDAMTWDQVDTGGYRPGQIVSDGSRLIAMPEFGGIPDTRSSTDGRTWQRLGGMDDMSYPAALIAAGTVVRAAGSHGIDAAIWHLTGDTWEPAELENDAGWLGAQDASPAVVYRIVSNTRGWIAVGQGPPATGSGIPEARAWSSADGETWAAEPLPDVASSTALGGFGGWSETDVVVGYRTPNDERVTAWVRRSNTWESASFHGPAPGRLGPVLEVNGTLVAIGFDDRSADGGILRSVVWGSTDGASWWSLPSGDLESGLVNDVFVTRQGRILGLGLRFDGPAMRGFQSAYGPALFELQLAGSGG